MKPSTKAIHVHGKHQAQYGEVSVPIFQSSTFAFRSADEGAARFSGSTPGYIYTRLANPTINALEEAIASLEEGSNGLATSTGMAAITTVFLALLQRGSHVVSSACVYGPTRTVLETAFARFGCESTFVDTSDLSQIQAAMRPDTRIVYLETPANPTMKISDIARGGGIADRASRVDDACGPVQGGARSRGDRRRAGADLGRLRGRRRSAGGSGSGAQRRSRTPPASAARGRITLNGKW